MLAPALLLACGPEARELPPSGIYQVDAVTLENACDPVLDDESRQEAYVAVAPDVIEIGFTFFLGGGNSASYNFKSIFLDPEDGRYLHHETYGEAVTGCRHEERVEVEVLDEQSLRAHIIDEWSDIDGCGIEGVPAGGCTVRRQYDYTLIEPCDDCDVNGRRSSQR